MTPKVPVFLVAQKNHVRSATSKLCIGYLNTLPPFHAYIWATCISEWLPNPLPTHVVFRPYAHPWAQTVYGVDRHQEGVNHFEFLFACVMLGHCEMPDQV
jgi:hypothetical protein